MKEASIGVRKFSDLERTGVDSRGSLKAVGLKAKMDQLGGACKGRGGVLLSHWPRHVVSLPTALHCTPLHSLPLSGCVWVSFHVGRLPTRF